MVDIIGYAGAMLLAFCAFPQAILSVIQGNSRGLSHMFLWSWYIGELFMLYFTIMAIGMDGPLFYNYAINSMLLSIIVYYKYFPREYNE